jgi:hypothetical protein
MMKDNLSEWVECCHCNSLIHEERGTAKWVKILEYLSTDFNK